MLAFMNLAPRRVLCLFSGDVHDAVFEARAWGDARREGDRVVYFLPSRLPPYRDLIERSVRLFAEAALTVWPDWYGCPGFFAEPGEPAWQDFLDRMRVREAAASRPVVFKWLTRAAAACRAGQVPWFDSFAATVQLRQLAQALATDRLTVVVALLGRPEVDNESLRGLSRVLEWIARTADAQVLAIFPLEWKDRPALGGISSDHVIRNAPIAVAEGGAAVDEPVPKRTVDETRDEQIAIVAPLRGRPHPASPGERMLADRLTRDAELHGLFEHNVPIATSRGDRYLVDLVWHAGKVVVEVDGYGFHASPAAFSADRRRDAELVLSDYLVLRLPHDEVVGDAELAVDRIRDFVRYRRRMLGTEEAS
jgi:very-short-patch-repair endonuclease